jgi:predicted Zn finger-like uncharacterized protein
MFTRCPNCSATFRITEAVLAVAGGDVQCGSCDTVFNANRALFDDSGTAIEPPTAGTADSLEFDVPEQDWQRFFIESDDDPVKGDERAEPELGADFADPAAESPEAEATAEEPPAPTVVEETANQPAVSLDAETADTETWAGFLHDDTPEEAESPAFVILDEGEPLIAGADDESPAADIGALPTNEQAPGADAAAPAGSTETVLDWNPAPAFPVPAAPTPRHTIGWLTASLAAALVLGLQTVHHFRDDLAADPAYGAAVRATYDRLDWPLYPSWPLDAYEVRGAKAILEDSSPGALDIIAELAVMGRQPVGLPMVRVVLRDRWSNVLASGIFAPAAYLAEAHAPSRVYAAGTLIPVMITVADPGSAAQGYELDICLPDRHFGLQCKAARDPFRR